MNIHFVKMNGRWMAQIFTNPDTCVSWQTVGARRDVDRIIRDQLTPKGIPWTIEDAQGETK